MYTASCMSGSIFMLFVWKCIYFQERYRQISPHELKRERAETVVLPFFHVFQVFRVKLYSICLHKHTHMQCIYKYIGALLYPPVSMGISLSGFMKRNLLPRHALSALSMSHPQCL